MKFKLDENFGARTQELFRSSGHDVQIVREQGLQGCVDRHLYEVCCTEQRCLVTLDLDFTDITQFSPSETSGNTVDTVLFRDIVERYGITQIAALRWLTRQCLRNPAGSLSVHRLYLDLKAQGLGVAKDALHAMVGHLHDAFLISTVTLATDSERRRNSNPRKVYPVDTGFISAFDRSGRTNAGHAIETVILHELQRRKAEIGYVRTKKGYEVDFHARFHDGPDCIEELIQVCADTGSGETLEREMRAMRDAAADFPRAQQRFLMLRMRK